MKRKKEKKEAVLSETLGRYKKNGFSQIYQHFSLLLLLLPLIYTLTLTSLTLTLTSLSTCIHHIPFHPIHPQTPITHTQTHHTHPEHIPIPIPQPSSIPIGSSQLVCGHRFQLYLLMNTLPYLTSPIYLTYVKIGKYIFLRRVG